VKLETERLLLRRPADDDLDAIADIHGDPEVMRYIGPGEPWSLERAVLGLSRWRAFWAADGFGMFVVEEKASGTFVGRVGPFYPPVWPGFEVGWGVASEFRGKGYAVEAARAAINWSFATFELDRIVHCIDRENAASQVVARRLGAHQEGETMLLGHACELWVTRREIWSSQN